jgi:hypothetical protein
MDRKITIKRAFSNAETGADMLHRARAGLVELECHNKRLGAAPGNFEVKRRGALEHSNDGMAVSSRGYSASNFTGSARWLMLDSRVVIGQV